MNVDVCNTKITHSFLLNINIQTYGTYNKIKYKYVVCKYTLANLRNGWTLIILNNQSGWIDLTGLLLADRCCYKDSEW